MNKVIYGVANLKMTSQSDDSSGLKKKCNEVNNLGHYVEALDLNLLLLLLELLDCSVAK